MKLFRFIREILFYEGLYGPSFCCKKKPIVKEKLDAYIKGKALRYGIMVYEVDPSYTSMIGKIKYMRHAKCPIHMCAAYTIGRRGMGFKDN